MNLHSVLLAGIAVATVAWVSANDAQAQTSAAPPVAQSTTATPDASSTTTPKVKHRRSNAMPTNDSTAAEKAATDRLNAQQLGPAAPSSRQTGVPQPGTVDSGTPGATPTTGTAPGTIGGTVPPATSPTLEPNPTTPNPNPGPAGSKPNTPQ